MSEYYRTLDNLRATGYMLLESTAYGDAAGLPVENWSAAEIAQSYGYLNKLIAPTAHPMFANEMDPGVWSDDTQLSVAVSKGLIAADGFDTNAQADEFVRAYLDTPRVVWKGKHVARGWGGSTVNSAERIIAGMHPSRSGETMGDGPEAMGMGNGVVIKLPPLVLWQAIRGIGDEERHAQYDALTTMTHDTDIARWATRVHGDFLLKLLRSDESELEHEGMAWDIISYSQQHERALRLDGSGTQALTFLLNQDLAYDSNSLLKHTDGRGFYVPQTLAMAYGAFLCLAADYEMGVYEAVNLGGDTDSVASITANMLNFKQKGDIIVPEDAVLLQGQEQLQKVSRELTDTAMKGV